MAIFNSYVDITRGYGIILPIDEVHHIFQDGHIAPPSSDVLMVWAERSPNFPQRSGHGS